MIYDSKTRLYRIYHGMKRRCYKKNERAYKYYGARGIEICDEWLASFLNFKEWALSHGYTDELTIERIDVNGNYEPGNCKWITRSEQKNNTTQSVWIEINGVKKTIKTWADENGIPYYTALSRIHRGVDPKLAVTAPSWTMWSNTDEARGKKRILKSKPVLQFTKDGQYVGRYESARQAAYEINGNKKWSENGITNCCRGCSKSAYGYVWRFEKKEGA